MIGFVKAVQVTVVVVMTKELNHLAHFGFRSARGGAHSSRTLMLDELTALLGYVDRPGATKADYLCAIEEENCLGNSLLQSRTNSRPLWHQDDRHSPTGLSVHRA